MSGAKFVKRGWLSERLGLAASLRVGEDGKSVRDGIVSRPMCVVRL